MAARTPSSLDLDYSEKDVRRRKKILDGPLDLAMDNQAFILKKSRVMLSTNFMPIVVQTPTSRLMYRTSLYGRHKCGASFGGGTIGRVAVYTYEYDNNTPSVTPTTGSYDIVLSDGTHTDTTTITSFSSTAAWKLLTVSNVVTASDDMSARTDLTITINNWVYVDAGSPVVAYLCGVYILNND
jgi:hypothetical protein